MTWKLLAWIATLFGIEKLSGEYIEIGKDEDEEQNSKS